jgi:glutathione S-transferase
VEGEGVLDDSPTIVRWADARAKADRKLLPPDGRARDEAFAIEQQLDTDFAPHVRRFAYFHLLPHRGPTLALMGMGTPRLEHALVRVAFPLLRRLMRKAMRIDAARSAASRDKVRRGFDAIGERLADCRPYLLGDRFGAADITFAAFAAPLVAPPEHPVRRLPLEKLPPALASEIQALRQTPAGAFALRLYREHRPVG